MTEFLIRHFVKNYSQPQDSAVRTAYGNLSGVVGIVCNLLLCTAKLVLGMLSGSIAIVADGLNNVSDASSSVITLIGFRLSAKPADDEHPFGHARIEYIAGLAVAVMIVVIGLELIRSSIEKILNPVTVEFTAITAAVLVGSILIKLWMMVFNRTLARRIDSSALEATAMDGRNDVITTSVVLLSAVISAGTSIQLDGWGGLAVALFILWSGIGIIRDTLSPLLGQAPDEKLTRYIQDKITQYDGVLGAHDLIVHDYGPGRRFASVHVEMAAEEDVLKNHDIIDKIERDFKETDHIELVIHFDPVITTDEEALHARNGMRQLIKSISPKLTMHDFRLVRDPAQTNLIFDVVVPHGFEMSDEQVQSKIQSLVNSGTMKNNRYGISVTIEHSYVPISDTAEE